MYSFSYLEPVCYSMSSLTVASWCAYSFLKRQVRWSGIPYLFQNFPQFIVIHTVKGFGIVNKAEIDVFLEFSCIYNDPAMLAIWSLIPLPFLKPAWISGSSRFTYCWSLAWRILSITLLYVFVNTVLRTLPQYHLGQFWLYLPVMQYINDCLAQDFFFHEAHTFKRWLVKWEIQHFAISFTCPWEIRHYIIANVIINMIGYDLHIKVKSIYVNFF